MADEEWLSTEEVADEIGVTPQSVRRYIGSGKLHARVLLTGARPTYRIRRHDLDAFLTRFTRDAQEHMDADSD